MIHIIDTNKGRFIYRGGNEPESDEVVLSEVRKILQGKESEWLKKIKEDGE